MTNTSPESASSPADATASVALNAGELTIGGDVVGRDKIIQNIRNIHQRALTAAEAAARDQALEREALAKGVSEYVQKLRARAGDTTQTRTSPYKGLLMYRIGDAELFFGRAQALAELQERLSAGLLTVLHAESGAGKSSLLQAGLMPRLLTAGRLPVYIRPYTVPPDIALKRALLPNLAAAPGLEQAPLRDFLREVNAVLGPETVVYLFLDQFEEVFTQQTEEARRAFARQFSECLDDAVLNVRWCLSLRSEFFGHLARFRPPLQNPFGQDYRLERLTRDEAQEVIEAPARRRGIVYEAGLVDALLSDLGQAPYAPTELQIVCSALYDELPPAENVQAIRITRALYDQLGGTRGILQNHVERVLTRDVPDDRRPAARRALELLISPTGRRIIRPHSELTADLGPFKLTTEAVDALLTQLVDSRLLRRHEPKVNHPEPGYELPHDYLVSRIANDPAVQARRAAQELLDQEVFNYQKFGSLLNADELSVIEQRQAELTIAPKAAELIARSQAAHRRRRGLVIGSVGLAALLLVIGALSGFSAVAAAQARAAAESAQAAAETRAAEAAAREAASLNVAAAAATSQAAARSEQALSESAAATAIASGLQAQAEAQQAQARASAAEARAQAAARVAQTLFLRNGLLPVDSAPAALAFDGERLWVSNETANTVQAFNPVDGALQWTTAVEAAPRALLAAAGRVWTANAGDNTVQALDPASGAVLTTIPVGARPAALAWDGARVWVANFDDDTVQALDPAAGVVVLTATVGFGPQALAWDGSRLWVAHGTDRTLMPIDPATGATGEPLEAGLNPAALLFAAGRLWVADRAGNAVLIVDPALEQVVGAIPVGVRPVALAANPDETAIWVAVQGDNAVQVIDPGLNRAGALIPVGNLPRALLLAADGLWVANASDNTVQVLDPGVGALAAPFDIEAGPRALAVDTGTQQLWVATQANRAVQPFDIGQNRLITPRYFIAGDPRALLFEGPRLWAATGGNSVQSVTLATGVINTPVRVGRDPRALAYDRSRLWVANTGDDTVQAINPQTRVADRAIPVGDAPAALAFDGFRLWVANSGDNTVQSVSPTSGVTGTPIRVGRRPVALVFDGSRLWTANESDNTVSVIEPATGAVLGVTAVGNAPVALAWDGDQMWVANFTDNTVQAIRADGSAFAAGKPIRVNSGPVALAFDGRRLWIVSRDKNTIQALTISK